MDGKRWQIGTTNAEERSFMFRSLVGSSLVLALALAAPALADFSGQTILGPLGPGSTVTGNTLGGTDDNDGVMSGTHVFFLWNGPDDVWQVNWPGGDLVLNMYYDNSVADLDLFLYTPASYDDSGNFSIINSGVENIVEPGAVPGTHYVLVDSTDYSPAGAYTLTVSPEPGTATLLALGVLAFIRRR
jgi:hypothetical protein